MPDLPEKQAAAERSSESKEPYSYRTGRRKVEKSLLLHNYRRSPFWTKEGEQRIVAEARAQHGENVGDKELGELVERELRLTRFQAARLFLGRIGELRAGPYLLYGLLGSGGQGLVFAARNIEENRFCAIKVMPPEATGNEQAVRRIHAEAEMLGSIEHPNVVRLHGFHEVPKPTDLPEGEVWIFSQTADQIRGTTDRYVEAPPDAVAHPYYTQRDRTRRKVASVLGIAAALLVTAGIGVGAWTLERREADRSTVALKYQVSPDEVPRAVSWDLRDRRFLETPEGGETYDLDGDQRLTLIPMSAGEGKDSGIAVHSLIESPQLRLVLRADGNARVATRPKGGGRYDVEEQDVEILTALEQHPENVKELLEAIREMRTPAPFAAQWRASNALWKFTDTVDETLEKSRQEWAHAEREALRQPLTVDLKGYGPVCLMDCGRLQSPDPDFGIFMLIVDGAKMKQLDAAYGSSRPIDENTSYQSYLFLQFVASGRVKDYWQLTPPIMSATPHGITRYTPKGLSLSNDTSGPLPLFRRFPVPTSPVMLQPHGFTRAARPDLRDPNAATVGLLGHATSLLGWVSPKAGEGYVPPNQLWNGRDLPTFRQWEQIIAQAAVACGRFDSRDPKVQRMLNP